MSIVWFKICCVCVQRQKVRRMDTWTKLYIYHFYNVTVLCCISISRSQTPSTTPGSHWSHSKLLNWSKDSMAACETWQFSELMHAVTVTEEVLDPVWNFPIKLFFFPDFIFFLSLFYPSQNLKPEFYLLGLDHYVLEQIVLKQLNEPVFNHSLKYKLGKS